MDLSEVVVENERGLHADGVDEHVAIHEGVAVPIAADPAADAEDRCELPRLRPREVTLEQVLEVGAKTGDLGEEGAPVVRERVLDLVAHGRLHEPQHPALPEGADLPPQALLVVRFFFPRERRPVPLGEEASHGELAIEDAHPLHLGRVRRQDRAHDSAVEDLPQAGRRHVGGLDPIEGQGERAVLARYSGEPVESKATVLVLILRDVRQVREVAERSYDRDGGLDVQRVEAPSELGSRFRVAVAAEPDRQLTDVLDDLVQAGPFAFAQGLAEEPAEEPDVPPDGRIVEFSVGHDAARGCATSGTRTRCGHGPQRTG